MRIKGIRLGASSQRATADVRASSRRQFAYTDVDASGIRNARSKYWEEAVIV